MKSALDHLEITVADVHRIAAESTDHAFNQAEKFYVEYHANRIAAILRIVQDHVREALAAGKTVVRVLDIGPHFLTRCMHRVFGKAVEIHTLGFKYHGMVPDAIVAEHHEYDFNRVQHREDWLPARQHDLVVMAEVIEHLYTSPNLVLQFIRSLLAPGGVLIVQTPNAVSLRRRWGLLTGANPFELIRDNHTNPGHFREYTAGEMSAYFTANGFAQPQVVKSNYWPTSAICRFVGALVPSMREGLLVTGKRVPNPVLDAPRNLDSTDRAALRASFDLQIPHRVELGRCIQGVAKIKNISQATWLPENSRPGDHGTVRIGGRILDNEGRPVRDFFRNALSVERPIAPGQELEVPVEILAHERGVWTVQFDLVAESVGWFGDAGNPVSRYTFEVV